MGVLGQGLDRIDGIQKITGATRYSADISLPRQAHAVLVLSAVPKGHVTRINRAEVQGMPGVVLVMTHDNAPRLPEGGRGGINPPAGRVLSLLQDREVHYDREPVAVVVAESLDQATQAAAALHVIYERSTAQLDFSKNQATAHSPGKVNGEDADSIRGSTPESALSGAQVHVVYQTPMEHHNPLEPHATLAEWHGAQLTVYDSTQYISGSQETLAKVLGISKNDVRVICRYVGGGFGCKGSSWSHVALCAMAARVLRRPVKLVLQRPQMFGPVGGRPQTVQKIRMAAGADGEFSDIQHDVTSHTSVLEDFTEPAALQTRIMYRCPSVRTTHRLVPLNLGTPTFQRAPGHATGTFALESAVDELAHVLAMDPVRLRLLNEPAQDPEKQIPWSGRSLRQCYTDGAAAFGWSRRDPTPGSMRDGAMAVGWGVAAATYPANRHGAKARARLRADGMLIVQSGTQELGTGTYTVMSQVASDAMSYPISRIQFELGDSDLPAAPVSGGSQSVASVAPAVQAASLALRSKLIDIAVADVASPVHGLPFDEVLFDNGYISARRGSRREALSSLVLRSGAADISAQAGAEPGPEKKLYSMHSFGAVFAEVHIDRELGVIRVPRVVARYDVGKLLNAKTGRSQLMGGIVWGIGMALMEETVLDPLSGRIVNANLAEYHVPTNADIGEIDVGIVEENDPYINPLGARGIGEIGITGVAAALANAVYHATGVRVRELPVTLDKLLV